MQTEEEIILDPLEIRIHNKNMEYRELPPCVIGVIKGACNTFGEVRVPGSASPIGSAQVQIGLAAMEPGEHLRELLKLVAEVSERAGHKIYLFEGKPEEKAIPPGGRIEAEVSETQ